MSTSPIPKRNRKTLEVFGSLLVLITFIAKDAVREHVKEKRDALAAAEFNDVLRRDHQQLQKSVDELIDLSMDNQTSLNRLSQPPENTFTDHSTEYLRFDFAQIGSGIRLAQMSYERARTLAEKLPTTPNEKQALKTEKADIERVKQQAFAVINHKQVPYLQQHLEASDVASTALAISTATDKLSSEIVKKAEENSEELERRYRLWTWISYILYFLGVATALAGKLLGNDDLGPGL